MSERDRILKHIQQMARSNGNKPPGSAQFEKHTQIGQPIWGLYWPRWGDALKEAGYEPNTLQGKADPDWLIASLASLTRKLGRVPVNTEFRIEARNTPGFPSHTVLSALGDKVKRARIVLDWSKQKGGYDDVISICEALISSGLNAPTSEEPEQLVQTGFVYLIQSRDRYKIGLSNSAGRREYEIKTLMPDEVELLHEIETDDPSGVERYWHQRFADKRLKGEWFKLSAADVRAFKRWKKIF